MNTFPMNMHKLQKLYIRVQHALMAASGRQSWQLLSLFLARDALSFKVSIVFDVDLVSTRYRTLKLQRERALCCALLQRAGELR